MRALLQVLGLVLYPFAVHVLILAEAPRVAVLTLVLLSVAYLTTFVVGGLVAKRKGRKVRSGPWLVVYSLLALTGGVNLATNSVYALFLPPIFINLGLMLLFANTLRSGAVPIIERMMQLAYRGSLPPPLHALARRLTWQWVFFFISAAVLALALGLYAPLATWSLFVNVFYYLLIVLLFLAQHMYRYLRFRQYGTVKLWNIIQDISPAGLWRGVKAHDVDVVRDVTEVCPK